jgi:hypothetical protein
MPAKKSTYVVAGKKHKDFASAAAAAVDLAVQSQESVAIVEQSPRGTFYINISATVEEPG